MQAKDQHKEGKHNGMPKYTWTSFTGKLIGSDPGTLISELNRFEKDGYEIWASHSVIFNPDGKGDQPGITVIARKCLKNDQCSRSN